MIENIKDFFIKNKDYSVFIVRIGLALVLLWFGFDEIINSENWFGFIPTWIVSIIPFSLKTFIVINGIFEIIVGSLLLIGFFTRVVAIISAFHLLSIALAVGYNDIAVRDFGLSLMAISLIFSGAGVLSLDNTRKNRRFLVS